MSESIYVHFGIPKYGWLPVNFNYDEFHIEFDASDGLNDPIGELYHAILNIQAGELKEITWWLEPGAYYFLLKEDNSNYLLTILESDDIHSVEESKKTLIEISGNYEEIIFPIKKAILDFSSKNYDEQHWSYIVEK